MLYENLGDGNKVLRRYNLRFLSRKEFKKIQGNDIRIIGYLRLRNKKDSVTDFDSDADVFKLNDLSYYRISDRRFFLQHKLGYIHVCDDMYIELVSSLLFIMFLFSVVCILLLFFMLSKSSDTYISDNTDSTKSTLSIEDNYDKPNDYDNKVSSDVEYITIDGYNDCTISSNKKYIEFGNSAENDVYLVYKVINSATDTELYSTNAIQPSKIFYWDAWSALSDYRGSVVPVRLQIFTYDVNTQSRMNGAVQDFKITVEG